MPSTYFCTVSVLVQVAVIHSTNSLLLTRLKQVTKIDFHYADSCSFVGSNVDGNKQFVFFRLVLN